MEQAASESWLGAGPGVEAIARGVGRDASKGRVPDPEFGLMAPRESKHAARGGLAREELEALVAQGLSIAEIAEAVDRCKTTVRYWLARHDLRTLGKRGRAENAEGGRGDAVILATCKHHGTTEFVLEGRGYHRCKRCRSERVSERRRSMKATLVMEAGGRCALCGYDRYVGALEFHHVDPSQKRQPVSNGRTIALDALRLEAQKCLLLCSNCHAEVEGGVAQVPLQFVDDRGGADAVGPLYAPL